MGAFTQGNCDMNESTESKAQDTQPQVNEQRRRLTRGGLAAPIVLGTLLSRPVLGAAPYNCTISGQLSGNTSSHGDPVECGTLGRSPGYWRQDQKDWPMYIYGSGMIDGSFKPIAIPTLDGSKQSTEGTLFTAPGFANAFEVKEETLATTVTTGHGKNKKTTTVTETAYKIASYPDVSGGNATLLQMVAAEGNDNKLVSLARAAVASLLNAYQFAPDYPLTPDQVVAMFNAVYKGGTYQINATTAWDQDQVMAYLVSLYNA
jgi:hypothetical protein